MAKLITFYSEIQPTIYFPERNHFLALSKHDKTKINLKNQETNQNKIKNSISCGKPNQSYAYSQLVCGGLEIYPDIVLFKLLTK